ncbi:hypothetical protein C7974DRAFT_380534 [Boeremia exigua]|uniref:uncharacterized protein n=1 Tax=Boeremia exigua TaxID=749465 RepID=UPI001E8D2FE9|nr:uncharacterized protein C7974DRAFT_380534 [Boeremia exigua]KAH6614170.1 hypothetical protein C7974DRAFT_380534 [Boeremia exigua]
MRYQGRQEPFSMRYVPRSRFAFRSARQIPPRPLQHLPEELLLRIFTYVSPADGIPIQDVNELRDLLCLSLVSRKFHRVVEPLLYQNVAITVGTVEEILVVPLDLGDGEKFTAHFPVPTVKGCNIRTFMRTMVTRPDLPKHVKQASILRPLGTPHPAPSPTSLAVLSPTDEPDLGYLYDRCLRCLRNAAATGDPIQSGKCFCVLPVRATLSVMSPLLSWFLRTMQSITYLDLSRYQRFDLLDPVFRTVGSSPTICEPLPFNGVRTLSISGYISQLTLADIWTVFALPRLERLIADDLELGCDHVDNHDDRKRDHWASAPPSGLQELYLHDVYSCRCGGDFLAEVFRVCPGVHTLRITTKSTGHSRALLEKHQKYFGGVRQLFVYPEPQHYDFDNLEDFSYTVDTHMDHVRTSTVIEHLVVSVADLFEIKSSDTFLLLEEARLNMMLPTTLRSLQLRVDTTLTGFPEFTVAMVNLCTAARGHFPVMQRIEIIEVHHDRSECVDEHSDPRDPERDIASRAYYQSTIGRSFLRKIK